MIIRPKSLVFPASIFRPRVSLLLFAFFFLPCALHAQEEFYHPELEWNTIETEHFLVHYHEGAERTGRVVAKIAEEIYSPVTSLYNHKPDQKVSFIINDHDDISNGAAYFYDNKIELYAPSMDFDLRGTHNWLRNVVTHEFTHIVQIQTGMKFGRGVPGIYFQWLGYESERRPDVLYGFPNIIASYPISGFVVPVWFAEGVAQYNRTDLRYDFWDSHRDMILRSYALDGNMLTWQQMGVFGKTSLGNESSYNAGFAFVSYIAKKYGEEKLVEISRNLGKFTATTIDGAIKDAVGKDGGEVYAEWRAEVEKEYAGRVAPIKANLKEGRHIPLLSDEGAPIEAENKELQTSPMRALKGRQMLQCCAVNFNMGFANLYPSYSRDGKKIAYVSNKNADYFSMSSLFVYDAESQKEKRLQGGVRTSVSWSPDGKKIYYGRTSRDNPHWSFQFDLYVYDIDKEEETRLTHGKRVWSPAVSPDGSQIAFVMNGDGTTNLGMMNSDGSNYHAVTHFMNGEQVYSPQWSPLGDRIIFDSSIKDGRDIASVKPDGSDLKFLVSGDDDSRSGVFTHDGSKIIFSSDRTGIFNLYAYDLVTESIAQITNVLGGAFLPTVNPAGDIVYASYTSGGYKILRLQNDGSSVEVNHHYIREGYTTPGTHAAEEAERTAKQFDWMALRSYNDSTLSPLVSKPYKPRFTSLTLVPFLRIDNYNTSNDAADAIKPGVYLFSNDVLDKTGFFAGAALNKRLERDLFVQFFYRSKIPLLYDIGLEPVASAELYNITRKAKDRIDLTPFIVPVDLSYNLLEFDFVLTQPFVSQFSNAELRFAHSRYTSIIESFINPNTSSTVPGFSNLYLIGNDLSLKFVLDAIAPSRTSEINPVGRKITLRIGREWNKLLDNYDIQNGMLVPVYDKLNFTRVELKWREHLPLFFDNHTLSVSLHAASILEHSVNDFFDYYAGGLLGMRGYPYYAIGGNEMAVAGLEYRVPLVHNIDARFLHLYFDKLYASVFADIGNAWTGSMPNLRQFKTDIGAELRLESFSWYAYPTRLFISGAYGFDQFARSIRSRDTVVTYGKEWRFYLGILFGFDFD